jgi:hypothetical protein
LEKSADTDLLREIKTVILRFVGLETEEFEYMMVGHCGAEALG